MLSLGRVNRFASLAILPLMALAIAFAWRVRVDDADLLRPREGLLVVANLRAESLSFVDLSAEQPAVRTLSVPGPPHELATLNQRLYVTLGRGDRLLEVDPRAPGLLRERRYDGANPHGLFAEPGRILVTLDAHGAIEQLNPHSLNLERAWPTGNTPHAVVAAGDELYITDSRDGKLRSLTGSTLIVDTSALPESVAIVGDLVVTADADGRALSVFRRVTLEPVARIPLEGSPVRVIPLDEARVLVALVDTSEVALVNLHGGQIERRIPVSDRPDGLCLSPSGDYLAVVSNAGNRVDLFHASDWKQAGSIVTPRGPGACLWLGSP
ncbi:MAG: hypothetical protein M0R74_07750 [Dehalococcoidia bacterium]|nr:hypothetical protein [Dehalococcoidia bacterium]